MLKHRHPTLFQPYQETLPGPACWPPALTFDCHFLTLVPSQLTATPLLSLYNLCRWQMLVYPDLRVPGQDGVSQLFPYSLYSVSGAGGCGPDCTQPGWHSQLLVLGFLLFCTRYCWVFRARGSRYHGIPLGLQGVSLWPYPSSYDSFQVPFLLDFWDFLPDGGPQQSHELVLNLQHFWLHR